MDRVLWFTLPCWCYFETQGCSIKHLSPFHLLCPDAMPFSRGRLLRVRDNALGREQLWTEKLERCLFSRFGKSN